MECPKCRHTIYLDLSLEDLIFCPYCDQRMIPPKEFNLCPVCSEELPVGASFCLKCGEKLVSEEKPVIDHTPVSPPDHSREDISGLANGEPPVAKEPVPVAEKSALTSKIRMRLVTLVRVALVAKPIGWACRAAAAGHPGPLATGH